MPANSALNQLPYAHLNLRHNPFGELSREELASLAEVDVESIVARLSVDRFAVQFVGEKGYGKTTHLLAIKARFAEAGYVHIPEGETAVLPGGRPTMIDEAQRLTLWQRFQLFRAAVPLVLGTHRDFSAELRRAGRTVETIEVEQRTDVHRLCRLLNARVEHVRRGAGLVPIVTMETATRLRREFGSNIRAMLHQMYVAFQKLSEVRDV